MQGTLYGVGTSDCAVLMLSSIIIYSFAIPDIWTNIINFILYGIGRAAPLMIISPLTIETKQRFINFFKKHPKIFSRLLPGILIITAGITVLILMILGI